MFAVVIVMLILAALLTTYIIMQGTAGADPAQTHPGPAPPAPELKIPLSAWQERLCAAQIKDDLYENTPRLKYRPNVSGRTWYYIDISLFCGDMENGKGTIAGITQMLDYIVYTGFDGILLSSLQSPDTDLFTVNPQYGTLKDFDTLVAACKKRGLRLLLELILNHTSVNNPWFIEHPEYYNIQGEPGAGVWQRLPDGRHYECQFGSQMPDFDLENFELRAELEKVFLFWLQKGADGFKLSNVNDYVTGNAARNIDILSWVNNIMKMMNPRTYIVADVKLTQSGEAIYLYCTSGINSFFSRDFAGIDGIIAEVLTGDAPIQKFLEQLVIEQVTVKEVNTYGTSAPFLAGIDTPRAADFLRQDKNLIKTAWGLSLFSPGNAFVYYGEEAGISGIIKDDVYSQYTPMPWEETICPQAEDAASMYHYVRKALHLRALHPSIGRGATEVAELEGAASAKVGAVIRRWENTELTIIYNVSAAEERVKLPMAGGLACCLSATGDEPTVIGEEIILPGYCIAVIKCS